jgi:hypothetical protein
MADSNPFGSQLLLRPWRAIRSILCSKITFATSRRPVRWHLSLVTARRTASPTDHRSVSFCTIIALSTGSGAQAAAKQPKGQHQTQHQTQPRVASVATVFARSTTGLLEDITPQSARTQMQIISPYDGAVCLPWQQCMRLFQAPQQNSQWSVGVGDSTSVSVEHPLFLCSFSHSSSVAGLWQRNLLHVPGYLTPGSPQQDPSGLPATGLRSSAGNKLSSAASTTGTGTICTEDRSSTNLRLRNHSLLARSG